LASVLDAVPTSASVHVSFDVVRNKRPQQHHESRGTPQEGSGAVTPKRLKGAIFNYALHACRAHMPIPHPSILVRANFWLLKTEKINNVSYY